MRVALFVALGGLVLAGLGVAWPKERIAPRVDEEAQDLVEEHDAWEPPVRQEPRRRRWDHDVPQEEEVQI